MSDSTNDRENRADRKTPESQDEKGTLVPPHASEAVPEATIAPHLSQASSATDEEKPDGSAAPGRKTIHSLRDEAVGHTLDPRNLSDADLEQLATLGSVDAISTPESEAVEDSLDATLAYGQQPPPDSAEAIDATLDHEAVDASIKSKTAGGGIDATLEYEESPADRSRGSGTWSHLVIRARSLQRGDRKVPPDGVDYELMRVLGQGAMGIVYQARQKSINRSVALKMLKSSRSSADRAQHEQFLAEAVVTGELAHPNIVPIYDLAVNQDGELFYSMKQVKGTPWNERLASNSLAENLDSWMRVADAIAFAHDRGVIHRDLKPENIMLGDFGEVLVMDWGIAVSQQMLSDPVTRMSSGLAGTPSYMAPEMGVNAPLHRLRPSADVYLMGAILYEIITGKAPHTGRDIWSCLQAVTRNEIVPTDKEGELVDIALKAMATDPEDRYASVQEMQAAIREYQSHAQSNTLVVRGDQELEEAAKTGDYNHYQQAILAFREALALWPENQRAAVRLEEARIACAHRALQTGDYDLGLSVLDPQESKHVPLVRQLKRKKTWRSAARAILFALIGIIVVGSIVASLWINAERVEANRQREFAEEQRQEAEDQRQLAEDAQREADANAEKAEKSAQSEEERRKEAEKERERAEEERERADEQRKIAVINEARARRQEQIAAAQAEEAAAAAYRSKIGLAASQIEANVFNRAKAELGEITRVSLEKPWFQPPPWEFARLQYLLDLSELTIPTGFAIHHVSVSADGQTIAVAGESNRVLLFPQGQAEPIEIPTPLQQVTQVKFSPSGRRLVIACAAESPGARGRATFTSEVIVWDLDAGEVVNRHQSRDGYWVLDFHLHGSDEQLEIITGLAKMSAVPGEPTTDVVQILQPSGREPLLAHNAAVTAVGLSPDGRILITADEAGVAWIWSRTDDGGFELLRARDTVVFMPNQGQTVHALRFSPVEQMRDDVGREEAADPEPTAENARLQRDRLVATAGGDNVIRLYWLSDLEGASRNQEIRPARAEFSGHTAAVLGIDFSADGELLVSASEDGSVRVWRVSDGQQIALLRGHWDVVSSCVFSPQDRDIIVSGSADRDLRVWSLAGYREALEIRSATLPEMVSARFSPDGSQVLTAHRREPFFGAAALWALDFDGDRPNLQQTLPRLLQEGHTVFVTRASVYPLGERTELMTVAADGAACFWDARRGTEVLRITGVLRRLNFGFPLAAMSADGRWIVAVSSRTATISEANHDFVSLWDRRQLEAGDESPAARLIDPVEHATAVAISASGSFLFSGYHLGKGVLWTQPDGGGTPQASWTIDSIGRPISAAWFSPDETQLFCVSEYVIRQFDVATGTESRAGRRSHNANVVAAATGWDAGRMIVAGADGTLTLWDLKSAQDVAAKPLTTLAVPNQSVQAVDITRDGQFVLAVIAMSQWTDVRVGEEIRKVEEVTEKLVRLYRVQEDGTLLTKSEIRFPDMQPESASFFSEDASQIVVVGGYEAVLWELGPQPTDSAERLRTFGAEGIPTSVRYSHDGQQVVTAHEDGSVKIWDVVPGRVAARLQTPLGETVHFACFSPDGQHVFTAHEGGLVQIWSAESGEWIREFCRHESGQAIYQIDFSPDGTNLAAGSADGTASIWNVQTGERLAELTGHRGAVLAVAFDPQGRWLATAGADQTVRVWDLENMETLAELRGHSKQVGAVTFSPDGTRLATGSADTTAKIWVIRFASVVPSSDASNEMDERTDNGSMSANGEAADELPPLPTRVSIDEILTVRGHSGEIRSVEFSADGRHLLTCGLDGQAIVWPSSSRPPISDIEAE